MKGIALLVVVGCASDPKPAPQPPGCVTLAGNASQDVAVTTDASVCLQLDTTALPRAHLMAELPSRPGTSSGFSISLVDPSGTTLADGGDLVIGQSSPYARAQLEWSPPAGATTDATLIVRAGAPTATTLSVSLFDPLD